jgi:C_GCAxxG_C_C family probable redox protein
METKDHEEIQEKVRDRYRALAKGHACSPQQGSNACCGQRKDTVEKPTLEPESEKEKTGSKQIRKRVYGHYQSGFHCAEVISRSVLEAFSEKAYPEAIKAASAFGGGIAGSTEELCGAFTGGVIALGLLVGRENPGEELRDCGNLTQEFKKRFKLRFGSLNCMTILDGFGEQQSPSDCVKLTAEAAVILADVVNDFRTKTDVSFDSYRFQPREKITLGQCPFKAGACEC